MRGRVNAVNMVFIGASNELGEFRAGVSAGDLGTVPAVAIGGARHDRRRRALGATGSPSFAAPGT